MPDGRDPVAARLLDGLNAIDAEAWNACAGRGNPFVSHAFLSALEDSGCTGPQTGWLARPLVVEDAAGGVLGCAPLYVKTDSYGEYVFDWGWADAYERSGGRYYPKLVCAVPFSPVPGPRLLVRPDAPRPLVAQTLAGAMASLAERQSLSSVHVNFALPDEIQALAGAGFLHRIALQFHWHNDGYRDFDDFLAAFSSRKRKAVRKERREVAGQGIDIRARRGAEITEAHWDAFFAFYMDTGARKWGQPYLNRDFFSLLGQRLGDRVILVLAESGDVPVAGALNLMGDDALYGRYWGCIEDYKFLHFELCYYQAIEAAITLGLARVEAGAQGPHKLQRGYLPVLTHSAHWITDPALREPVRRAVVHEAEMIRHERDALLRHSPYRQD